MSSDDRFDAIRRALRHRRPLEAIAGTAPLVAGAWLALRTGAPDFVLAGMLVAPLTWFGMRVALDVVDVVAETLLPR